MSRNYAYIDSNNIYLGVQKLGWAIDYGKLRRYLKDKYDVTKAYYFIGYVPNNEPLYKYLKTVGYKLKFKTITKTPKGEIKGNIDADLVFQVMLDYHRGRYEQAVILTSDGDYKTLVEYLDKEGKLRNVLSTAPEECSVLLKQTTARIAYLINIKHKIGVFR